MVAQPYKAPRKIGRNEKVTINHPNGETTTIKYKKFDSYKEKGWLLSEV